MTNEAMLKRVLCIDSRTDLVTTAAYICAAQDTVVRTGNPLSGALMATRDLLHAVSYVIATV